LLAGAISHVSAITNLPALIKLSLRLTSVAGIALVGTVPTQSIKTAEVNALESLPPRIGDPKLLALLVGILGGDEDARITAALRERLFDREFSWQALVDFASGQNMLFPLIWGLRRRSLTLPLPRLKPVVASSDHPTAVLERAYARHLVRRSQQREQLLAVIRALNEAKITVLLLKGARYLASPGGPWCEARDMRDLDLLVRKEEASRTVEALTAAGYCSSTEAVPTDQHLPELWCNGCPSAVEIHIEALAYSARKVLNTDTVWKHAIPSSAADVSFLVLPPQWHMLHGLLHHQISDRCHRRHLLAVKALWEFAMLGRDFTGNEWGTIAGVMAESGSLDVLGSFLCQAERLFGLAPPDGIKISVAAARHAEVTVRHAARADWLRRGVFLADQLRYGFSRETMAVRYGVAEPDVTTRTAARHIAFLLRRYRGQILRRLTGANDRSN
jgi:hypothetical protein